MYTIYICIAILIVMFSFVDRIEKYTKSTWENIFISIWSIVKGSFWGFVIGIIIALFIPADKEYKIDHTFKLESLQDNNSVKGNFFLGCGTINGSFKYSFYYKYKDGYKLGVLDYEDVTVEYSDSTPKAVRYKESLTKSLRNKYSITGYYDIYYIIHVPKGTIKQDFNLDAL